MTLTWYDYLLVVLSIFYYLYFELMRLTKRGVARRMLTDFAFNTLLIAINGIEKLGFSLWNFKKKRLTKARIQGFRTKWHCTRKSWILDWESKVFNINCPIIQTFWIFTWQTWIFTDNPRCQLKVSSFFLENLELLVIISIFESLDIEPVEVWHR